jgi:hypothetical protein
LNIAMSSQYKEESAETMSDVANEAIVLADAMTRMRLQGISIGISGNARPDASDIVAMLISQSKIPRFRGTLSIDVDPVDLAAGSLGRMFDELIGTSPKDADPGMMLHKIGPVPIGGSGSKDCFLSMVNLSSATWQFNASKLAGGSVTLRDIASNTVSTMQISDGDQIVTAILRVTDGRSQDAASGQLDAAVVAGTSLTEDATWSDLRDTYVSGTDRLLYNTTDNASRAHIAEWAIGNYTSTIPRSHGPTGVYATYPTVSTHNPIFFKEVSNGVENGVSATDNRTDHNPSSPALAVRGGGFSGDTTSNHLVTSVTYYILRRAQRNDIFRQRRAKGEWKMSDTFGNLNISQYTGQYPRTELASTY